MKIAAIQTNWSDLVVSPLFFLREAADAARAREEVAMRHYHVCCLHCGKQWRQQVGRSVSHSCAEWETIEILSSERAQAARRVKDPRKRVAWLRSGGSFEKRGNKYIPRFY